VGRRTEEKGRGNELESASEKGDRKVREESSVPLHDHEENEIRKKDVPIVFPFTARVI